MMFYQNNLLHNKTMNFWIPASAGMTGLFVYE